MEYQMLYIYIVIMVSFQSVITSDPYTLGSNCSFALGTECPNFRDSMCSSDGKCVCQPEFYEVYSFAGSTFLQCDLRSLYGSGCGGYRVPVSCSIGLVCTVLYAHGPYSCLCPLEQFRYPLHTGMCRNASALRADNLHLNGSPNETELSLTWDHPLNISYPLTYRMEINGTENITPIHINMYTLTNRQPGTPYQIQIYTSTFKDFGVTEEKIENNNPLQGTFCTKPSVPGSLATKIYSYSSVTLQFFKSDGRVESYIVTVTSNSSRVSQNQLIKSDGVVRDWRNATFSNLEPGELYDVTIKAISCGLESEERIDYFIIQPAIPGSLKTNTFSNPNVSLQFSKSEGRVERYNVTIIANSLGKPFTQLFTSDGATGVWRNVTFYNLEPGEFYDVRIKAISWGMESEDRLDYFVIKPTMAGTYVDIINNEGSSVTLTFHLTYGHVNSYLVTVYNTYDYPGQYLFSFTAYINDQLHTSTTIDNIFSGIHYEFRIKARSWDIESEEKRYPFYKPIYNEHQESDASYGILVGSIVGGLCLFIIVVVTICIALRRRRRQAATSVLQQSNQLELPSMSRVQQSDSELAKIQGPCVRLDQFIQYVDQMNKQDNDPLRREFKKLKVSIAPELTTNIGRLKVNNVKNRYFNAVPYDHTRVKLLAFGDGFNDYINASYIAGPRSSCDYIATQGPMFSTTPDFWRMVCEHRSSIIVMLSDFSEDGQRKLDKYWPDQLMTPVLYGEVLVEVTSCSIATTTTIRKMTVSMTGRNKLTVTHIFSPGWKNYAYTLGLDELYDVIGSVRKVAPSNEGPITVHCSSGIGRTGMFISLDTLMRILVKTDLKATVNVNSVVKTILECRPHIIQSEDQYIFIHTALSAFIEKKKQIHKQSTSDPRRLPSIIDERHIYASLDETVQMKQRDTHF